MKKLKSLLLFFVCGLVACAMAIPLAACNDGTGGDSFYHALADCDTLEHLMERILATPMDKTDPDHIEIAILADDASKVNRIFDRLQLDVVDTGMAEAVDEVAQDMEAVHAETTDTPQKEPQKEETPVFPSPARRQTEPEPVSPSMHSSNSSEKSPPMWPGFRADQVRAQGRRASVRLELGEIRAILAARKEHSPMPRTPIRIRRDGPIRG